ncbi:unnamed protein product [Discula destructiva]
MPASSRSDSAQDSYSRRQKALASHPELAVMDRLLAGQGTWIEGTHSRKREPQYNHATLSATRLADYAGGAATHEPAGNTSTQGNSWSYPATVWPDETLASFDHTEGFGPTAHQYTVDCGDAQPQEQLAARQLTPTALASFCQPGPANDSHVHEWVPAPVGHRLVIPMINHEQRPRSRHHSSNRQRSQGSSSWVIVPAPGHNVEGDTQGLEAGNALSHSTPSYSTWIELDQVSETQDDPASWST